MTDDKTPAEAFYSMRLRLIDLVMNGTITLGTKLSGKHLYVDRHNSACGYHSDCIFAT